jgi:hypothetical protein
MRLVQLRAGDVRRVALVEDPTLRLLHTCDSVYALAQAAIASGSKLTSVVNSYVTDDSLDYEQIYRGSAKWKLLPPIDHPQEPACCLVSGTGLTHMGSARDRQSMHLDKEQELTDSMKMFHWGVEAGRPQPGEIGIAPEWFYKGNGSIMHAHNEPLIIPSYADDGGEEAEIAAAYVIGPDGLPYRVVMDSFLLKGPHRTRSHLNGRCQFSRWAWRACRGLDFRTAAAPICGPYYDARLQMQAVGIP